jgi:hypothetical protein
MKTCLLLLVLLVGGIVAGCTPTETWGERNRRINRVMEMNWREFNEDSDRLWMLERNQKDNPWNASVGF